MLLECSWPYLREHTLYVNSCLCAELHHHHTNCLQNKGQVVDAAMVDGVAYFSSFLLNSHKLGIWTGQFFTKHEKNYSACVPVTL